MAIRLRTKLENAHNKCRTNKSYDRYKRQRNHCANMHQRLKSNYFTKICEDCLIDSRTFWEKLKPYFFSKSHGDQEITVSENDCLVSNPQ